ncbi:MAG: hypothetical protein U0175_14580 [Caldilineaceae bacterium]
MILGLLFLFFALAWWLGLYLLKKSDAAPVVRWIGAASLVSSLLHASQAVMPTQWAQWLVVVTLLDFALGIFLAHRHATHWGEAFLPEFLRSLDAALLFTVFFAGPVVITMMAATGATLAMRILLLVMIALATATQLFAEPIQALLDRVAISLLPVRTERAELRSVVEALPKLDPTLDLNALSNEEFVRLTRRALSQYGDLAGLSSSPLTRLLIIEQRLQTRNATGHTIERTTELKQLLLEAIQHLKPSGALDFDTSDAWRHYNALYFPYVVGLRPYNTRLDTPPSDATARRALEWLRNDVPQRTLHNWQNNAAKLVALYLREVKQ